MFDTNTPTLDAFGASSSTENSWLGHWKKYPKYKT